MGKGVPMLRCSCRSFWSCGQGLGASAESTVNRGCDAKYRVLDRTDLREIGHGKQMDEKRVGETTIRKEVKGLHEELKLDTYGLTSVKTCYGKSLETQVQERHRPDHKSLMSSSSGSSRHEMQTVVDGVIVSKNVLGQARQDQSTGTVTTTKSADGSSYDRNAIVCTDERRWTFREERKGVIKKGKIEGLSLMSQNGSSIQYKSCCMMDYRTVTKTLENGVLTVSDEGLFLKSVTSGKGGLSQNEDELVLKQEESRSTQLSSHSCQGIAGALGSGVRHYLREGKVDKDLAKAAAQGAAHSWGMSIVTQSIERRVTGGGAAAFAVLQAAQESIGILRDPTKTKAQKAAERGGSAVKALVVWSAVRTASKRMMVSAASWIVPVVEIGYEGVRTIVSYLRGEITWARCRSNLTKAVCVAAPTALGGWGGAQVGAIAGSFLGPVGGALGGAIGAVLGGILGEKAGSAAFANVSKAADFADSCLTFRDILGHGNCSCQRQPRPGSQCRVRKVFSRRSTGQQTKVLNIRTQKTTFPVLSQYTILDKMLFSSLRCDINPHALCQGWGETQLPCQVHQVCQCRNQGSFVKRVT